MVLLSGLPLTDVRFHMLPRPDSRLVVPPSYPEHRKAGISGVVIPPKGTLLVVASFHFAQPYVYRPRDAASLAKGERISPLHAGFAAQWRVVDALLAHDLAANRMNLGDRRVPYLLGADTNAALDEFVQMTPRTAATWRVSVWEFGKLGGLEPCPGQIAGEAVITGAADVPVNGTAWPTPSRCLVVPAPSDHNACLWSSEAPVRGVTNRPVRHSGVTGL